MTLLDQIKADRAMRSEDPLSWPAVDYHQEDMEVALLAAGELADAVDGYDPDDQDACAALYFAVTAFRSAIEVK